MAWLIVIGLATGRINLYQDKEKPVELMVAAQVSMTDWILDEPQAHGHFSTQDIYKALEKLEGCTKKVTWNQPQSHNEQKIVVRATGRTPNKHTMDPMLKTLCSLEWMNLPKTSGQPHPAQSLFRWQLGPSLYLPKRAKWEKQHWLQSL